MEGDRGGGLVVLEVLLVGLVRPVGLVGCPVEREDSGAMAAVR